MGLYGIFVLDRDFFIFAGTNVKYEKLKFKIMKKKRKSKKRAKPGYYTIDRVYRSFEGRGGWGYNDVGFSEITKTVELRQRPNSSWKVGDKVPKSLVKRLKDSR